MGNGRDGSGVHLRARRRVVDNLEALLELRGFSQRAFCNQSGICRSSLRAVLAGQRNVGLDLLETIAVSLRAMTWGMLAPAPPPEYIQYEAPEDFFAREILATRIESASTRLGLTIGDVARLCRLSPSHLYAIKTSCVCTGIDCLPAIADALRSEMHELLVPVAQP